MECVVETGQPFFDAINNQVPTFADCRGNLTTGQYRAEKLEDRGNENRLFDRQRFGADRRRHGVGHIVGANTPRHEKAEHTRQDDIDDLFFHGNALEEPSGPNYWLLVREQQL
jgi:hypothetical protein